MIRCLAIIVLALDWSSMFGLFQPDKRKKAPVISR